MLDYLDFNLFDMVKYNCLGLNNYFGYEISIDRRICVLFF